MSTIRIDGIDCAIAKTLRPGLVIADAGGAFAYASDESGDWEWWAGEQTPEMAQALRDVIDEHGGFDTTVTTVTKA